MCFLDLGKNTTCGLIWRLAQGEECEMRRGPRTKYWGISTWIAREGRVCKINQKKQTEVERTRTVSQESWMLLTVHIRGRLKNDRYLATLATWRANPISWPRLTEIGGLLLPGPSWQEAKAFPPPTTNHHQTEVYCCLWHLFIYFWQGVGAAIKFFFSLVHTWTLARKTVLSWSPLIELLKKNITWYWDTWHTKKHVVMLCKHQKNLASVSLTVTFPI